MNKPVAVLISDVHYNRETLEVADTCVRQAISKANELKVPLIVAGDLHDTKANLRGECVNRMIETFKLCDSPPYILVGNHCKINEKSEEHILNFLRPYAAIIDYKTGAPLKYIGYLVPYEHDIKRLIAYLKGLPNGSQVIMHQGIQGSNAGEYFQDPTALHPDDVSGLRIISGHYHARQTIPLPDSGKWDFIGNPYTLNFGEAKDPIKGFQILNSDGSLEFVPTNIRKHIVGNIVDSGEMIMWGTEGKQVLSDDILKIIIHCPKENAYKWTHDRVSELVEIDNFRLEIIANDATDTISESRSLTREDQLDSIIDALGATADHKTQLKSLWRSIWTSSQ